MRSLLTQFSVACLGLLLLPFFSAQAQGPDFEWAKSAGGTGNDSGNVIALDGSGNSYVTGSFQGSASFGSTTLTSSGGYDIFIAKYNASGNVIWANKAGGTGDDFGLGIAVDGSGNCYITGHFQGNALFGSITLSSNGSTDGFVAKFDAAGNPLWAQKAGGAGSDSGRGIALDGSGNCYVTGAFQGSASFGSTTLTSSGTSGTYDIFIAKYNPSGNVLWAKKAGGTGDEFGRGIALDGSGNCYITGYFGGSASFGSTTLTSNGANDVFIAKYDASGNVLWAKKAGGTGDDFARGIALDVSGNIYVTGDFWGITAFGSITLSNSGYSDVFVAKFDATGNPLWAQKAGGADLDFGHGVAVDGSGNSYVTGAFQGTATFGSTTLTSSGGYDIFIAKYDASGNVLWAWNAGGGSGQGIALDGSGNSYITGSFNGSATFGSTSLTSSGGSDIFLAKFSTITGLPKSSTASLSAYPNPFTSSFQLTLSGTGPATAILTDMLGREVHRQVIGPQSGNITTTITPPAPLQPGMYLLQLQQGETTKQVRVVKQ